MIRYLFVFVILLLSRFLGFSQVLTVNYNLLDNQLNSGIPIPAEEPFQIKGALPKDIIRVEALLYRDRIKSNADHKYSWKLPFDFQLKEFDVYIADALRGNERYIIQLFFYKKASVAQVKTLQLAIHNNLEAYIEANYSVERKGITSMSARHVVKNNLNKIVSEGSIAYQHYLPNNWKGFSDIVNLKIDELQNASLKNARFNIVRTKKEVNLEAAYASELLQQLKNLVKSEVDQYLNTDMLILTEVKQIEARTAKTINYLPINVGYSGVFFSGDTRSLDYGRSPYVGISVPLANSTFKKYLGNASLSAGLMTNNLINGFGDVVSGPIVGRPIYAALGYKILKVMRFNAGAVLTSKEQVGPIGNSELIQVFPFVGISLELNFWVGFNKR